MVEKKVVILSHYVLTDDKLWKTSAQFLKSRSELMPNQSLFLENIHGLFQKPPEPTKQICSKYIRLTL